MLRGLKKLDEKRAQVIMSEYVLIFFLIIGMISSMTVFFKRAVQARYFDAQRAMFNIVSNRVRGNFNGSIYIAYEPYYVNSTSQTYHDVMDKQTLGGGGNWTSGVFTREIDEFTQVKTNSVTAAPKDAQ